jgi:prepilin-type processing-associated H-X9-DG protein
MNSWAASILWAMLQVTLLSSFGLCLYLLARRRGPAAGALATVGTLLAVLVVTLLAFAPLPQSWNTAAAWESFSQWRGAPEVAQVNTNVEAAPAATPTRPIAATPTNGMAYFWEAFVDEMRQAPVEQSGARRRWPLAVLALFGLGAAFGLFRLIAGATAVGSYRRQSKPIADAALYRLVQSLREETGCTKDVELRESIRLSTPATVGCFKPLVLLPIGWREWSQDELRAVLAHELAHVARGDYLSGLLAQVTLAVHFYHPLVHWLVGRLRLEQELAADASGMRASGGRDFYLVTLAGMALRQDDLAVSWAARPFLPTRGTFMRRIEMLRDSRKQLSASLPRGGRMLLIGALAMACLVVAGLRPGVNNAALAQQTGVGPAGTTASGGLPLIAVSPDVKIHMAARPAAILSKPELAPLAKQLAELFNRNGLNIEQLELISFSMVVPDEGDPIERFVLRNTTDTDWKAFIEEMPYGNSAKEISLGRHKFTLFDNSPAKLTAFAIDGRTIVIQPEHLLKDYLAWADSVKSQDGAGMPSWAKLWDKVGDGQAAVGIDPAFIRPRLDKMPIDRMGPMLGFAPLWKDTNAAVLGIGLEDGMKIQGFAEARDAEAATRIVRTLDAAKALFLNMEPTFRKQAMTAPAEVADVTLKAIDAGAQVINSAKVSANGTTVELKAEGPGDVAVTVAILAPAIASAREAARRVTSMNNLKQIGLAMHNYAAVHNQFPPAVIIGPDGKTPHSWRVAVLPYLEQYALYQQYKFDEPWDSANNKQVMERMPAVFRHPSDDRAGFFSSYYVLTGPTTLFDDSKGAQFSEILDGTSNTVLTVEAKRDIPWTKPEDIPFDPSQPLPELGGFNNDGVNVGFADGSVRFMSKLVDPAQWKAFISKAGGEIVQDDRVIPPVLREPTPPTQ